MPTRAEGCCNAIIEALACGLPVISSNKAFNDEILNDEYSIRIDEQNEEKLYLAISDLKDNAVLRNKMAHVALEKAKELRNATPMVHNCAQTIMEVYADDLGINKELANHLGCNFGGGMKCGSVCGAVTSGLMILGAKEIDSPAKVNQFIKTISNNHQGLINCADLLRENAKNGGQKKPHCDGMIQEVIELIDQMEKEND